MVHRSLLLSIITICLLLPGCGNPRSQDETDGNSPALQGESSDASELSELNGNLRTLSQQASDLIASMPEARFYQDENYSLWEKKLTGTRSLVRCERFNANVTVRVGNMVDDVAELAQERGFAHFQLKKFNSDDDWVLTFLQSAEGRSGAVFDVKKVLRTQ